MVVSSLPVAWDWWSLNGVLHVKHGELLMGGDWSALFSFTGCCGGVWCFTWNIDISVDNEAYSSLGKTIYISRWRIRKSMSASLVFLAPRSESCVGALNKLHGFTWNVVGWLSYRRVVEACCFSPIGGRVVVLFLLVGSFCIWVSCPMERVIPKLVYSWWWHQRFMWNIGFPVFEVIWWCFTWNVVGWRSVL